MSGDHVVTCVERNDEKGKGLMQRLFLYAVIATSLLVGCDTVTPSAALLPPGVCLVLEDVDNIPPGDATGDREWGEYRIISKVRQSCGRCGLNTFAQAECSDAAINPDARTTFTQTGGVLVALDSTGTEMRGGINADGTFKVGATMDSPDDGTPASGQGLVLLEGVFDGNQIQVTMTGRLTMSATETGDTFDLQSVLLVTLERVE